MIGLSGALHVQGRFQDWPLYPDLNAQQAVASWTASLMSPHSPEVSRREVWWTYSQGGPGIYRGDTYFYSEDLDLRGVAGTIDTTRCSVYLFTGEHDHACMPDDTAAALAAIPGARGGAMPGIGHFPMAENCSYFRTYLLPALAQLAADRSAGHQEGGEMTGIDAHCHVFTAEAIAARLVGAAAYQPPQVDVDDHAAHLAAVDCDRGVLVQPSAYGSDHRCLLAALRSRPDRLRGVACVPPGTSRDELAEMHAAGVRGTRLQDGYPGGVPVESLLEVGETVAPLGWHVELWTDVRRHVDWLGDAVRRCPVPVVLDHLGYLPSDVGLGDPAVRLMLELLAEDQVWVTLSGVERLLPAGVEPDAGSPGFGEAWRRHEDAIAARVRAFVDVRPENLLWGSDWPHVGVRLPVPASGEVRARLDRWIPDPAVRRRILVDNPVRRYGFEPASGRG
ncbi:amidohydrolase family protein [Pseudonocardia nigra]|uniref:amidohydrolase family protein n=1 Tax=Pseudonocardia nigra TaxID=1921578 RepID=UPI001C5DD2F7|nr:amidohydrolase family protein [Pseudonocardia nigra]